MKMTQHEVAQTMGLYPNLPNEIECGKRGNTIYILHKVFLFLGYIPKTLNIDETTLQGKLFTYRIKNNLTYSELGKQINLDKSTLSNFEKGFKVKIDTLRKIEHYFKKCKP